MGTIAIYGGNLVTEVGTVTDVQFFFECIKKYAVGHSTDPKWTLITDRFYRRYITYDNLSKASALMDEIRRTFSIVKVADITMPPSVEHDSRLDVTKLTLADLFEKYFDTFLRCKESAERLFSKWKEYVPVRIVIVDTKEFVEDSSRNLEDYEKLTGEPLWKR